METSPRNPFKGLRPYQENDRLFGRDKDLILMLDRIFSGRTTLLFAGSGVGKTSFLNAKVIPELKEQYCVIWHSHWTGVDEEEGGHVEAAADQGFRLWPWPPRALFNDLLRKVGLRPPPSQPQPISVIEQDHATGIEEQIASEVRRTISHSLHKPDGKSGGPLTEVLSRFKKTLASSSVQGVPGQEPPKERCVLILDQFEEVFQYHASEDYFDDFVIDLCEIINNEDYQVRVVFSMREEFLGELSIFDNRISDIFNNYYRLKYPDKVDAREIIRSTSELEDVEVNKDNLAALIEDLSVIEEANSNVGQRRGGLSAPKAPITKRNFVAPPYLQIACERIWNEQYGSKKSGPIRAFLDHYQSRTDSNSGAARESDAHRVLREFCEEKLSPPNLVEVEQWWAAGAFDYLVTKRGAKMAYDLDTLADHMNKKDSSPLRRTLEKLSSPDARILRKFLDRHQTPWFELYHDMYGPIVDNWKHRYRRVKRFKDLRRTALALVALIGIPLFVYGLRYSVNHWLIEAPRDRATLAEFKNKLDGSNLEKAPGYLDAVVAFHRLRETFGYSGEANHLWADVLARRAQWYACDGQRDNALLNLLKAAALETDSGRAQHRLREAELLVDGDYASLVTTYGANIVSVDLSSNDKYVLTRNRYGEVMSWEINSGAPISRICDSCLQALFSVDGNFIVTSSVPEDSDNRDTRPALEPAPSPVSSSIPTERPEPGITPTKDIQLLLWVADSDRAVAGPLILRHSEPPAKVVAGPSGSSTRIRSVAQQDSTYFIAEIYNGKAYVWSSEYGGLQLIGQLGPSAGIWFSRDGKHLLTQKPKAADSEPDSVELWTVSAKKVAKQPKIETPERPLFSPDGKSLMTSARDFIRLWDLDSATVRLQLPPPAGKHRFGFSPEGKQFFIAIRNEANNLETIQVRDTATGSSLFKELAFEGDMTSIFLASQGKNLIRDSGKRMSTGLGSVGVENWDLQEGRRIGTLRIPGLTVGTLFRPDHSFIQTSLAGVLLPSDTGGTPRLWRIPTDKAAAKTPTGTKIALVATSRDGKILAVETGGKLQFWNLKEGTPLGEPMEFPSYFSAALSGNGEYLALDVRSEGVRVAKVPSNNFQTVLRENVEAFALSDDGKVLVAATEGNIVRALALPGGNEIWAGEKGSRVRAIAVHNDSVLSEHYDGTIFIRDLLHGAVRHVLKLRRGNTATAAALSADSKLALTGDDDGMVQLWDAVTGQALGGEIKTDDPVFKIAFDRDGDGAVVLTRSWYYLVRVDRNGVYLVHMGVLPGVEARDRLTDLGDVESRLRFAYRGLQDTLIFEDVELERADPAILTGDPKQILKDWQHKLGLQITDEGRMTRREELSYIE